MHSLIDHKTYKKGCYVIYKLWCLCLILDTSLPAKNSYSLNLTSLEILTTYVQAAYFKEYVLKKCFLHL